MNETASAPEKDQEALMKSEGVRPQEGFQVMYGAPPPPYPYYTGPPSGDATYVPGMQAVMVQPHGGIQYVTPAVAVQAVPDHLIYSVMATICCCWPIGLFAIFKSIECRNAINRGDLNNAVHLSRQTRRLANWTIGVGVLFAILTFLMMGVYVWLTISQMH